MECEFVREHKTLRERHQPRKDGSRLTRNCSGFFRPAYMPGLSREIPDVPDGRSRKIVSSGFPLWVLISQSGRSKAMRCACPLRHPQPTDITHTCTCGVAVNKSTCRANISIHARERRSV